MRLTVRDVEHIVGLVARARREPIGFEELTELCRAGDHEAMLERTERCRLSNGWLVMFNYEYQRPTVRCRHLAVGFPNAHTATVMAVSRIMEILGFKHTLRELPGWTDYDYGRYAVMIHAIEPDSVSLEEFHRMSGTAGETEQVQAGGDWFSD